MATRPSGRSTKAEPSNIISAALATVKGHDQVKAALSAAGGVVAEALQDAGGAFTVAESAQEMYLTAVAEAVEAAGGPARVAAALEAAGGSRAVAEAIQEAGGTAAVAEALSDIVRAARL